MLKVQLKRMDLMSALCRVVGDFVNSIRARLRYPDIGVYLLEIVN